MGRRRDASLAINLAGADTCADEACILYLRSLKSVLIT